MRLPSSVESVVADVRYAVRGFARRPLYAISVVLLLALGIGANTALFDVVYHELVSPLPFRDGNRMVRLLATGAQGTILLPVDEDVATAWQRTARTVEQVIVLGWGTYTIGDSAAGTMRHITGVAIPPGASAFVGMHPELGRDIDPADTLPGAAPVALIGDAMWRTDFARDPRVLGRSLTIDGVRHTIVGVVPSGYRMPFIEAAELFIARRALSSRADAAERNLRGPVSDVEPLAKLRDGRSVEDANREMAAIFARVRGLAAGGGRAARLGVATDVPRVVRAVDLVRPWLRQTILVLFGAVSLVLLIACANVANLLLVRAWSRQREFAVRAAIGATRGRLMAHVLTESVVLSAIGAAFGIGVAVITLRAIRATPWGAELNAQRFDPTAFAWCGTVAIVTALLFGLVPARFAAENRVTEALKAGARAASGSRAARRFRSGLVSLEVALSVVLLCGAGLLLRTLVAMERADVGVDTRGLVSFDLRFASSKLPAPARQAIVHDISRRLRAVPGVSSVTLASVPAPRFAIGLGGLHLMDRELTPSDSVAAIGFNAVDPGFFAAVGLRVARGRVFDANTSLADTPSAPEVMINERFARRFWPSGDALGKRIMYGKFGWSTIVGVVRDVDIPGVNDPARALQLYTPISPAPARVTFVVRSTVPVARLAEIARGIAHDAGAGATLRTPVVAEDVVSAGRVSSRYLLMALAAFAAVALVLAAIGLHAVVSYSVSQRTREIGMRVALGADRDDVMRLVLGQGVALAAVGTVIGCATAIAATRALRAFLYGVVPGDPLTVASVGALLLAIALLATLPPAWRAARLDPVEALRAD